MTPEELEAERRRRAAEEARRILEESGAAAAVRSMRTGTPQARALSPESAEPPGQFATPLDQLPEARIVASSRSPQRAGPPPAAPLEQQARDLGADESTVITARREPPYRPVQGARSAEAAGQAYRAGRPEPYRAEPSDWEMEDLRVGRPGATQPPAVPPPAALTPAAGGAAVPAGPSGQVRDRLREVLAQKFGAPVQAAMGRSRAPVGGDEQLAPAGIASGLGDPSQPLPPPPARAGAGLIREWDGPAPQSGALQPPAGPLAPQGRDYTGIDIADRLVSPLRGLARGLLYASGRSPGPLQTWGAQQRARDERTDALEAQRAAQEASAQRLTSADDLARERLGLDRERMQMQGQERAADRSLRQQMQERAAELRASGMSEQEALSRARREQLQSEMQRRVAMRDASTPESATERAGLLDELATVEAATSFRVPPAVRASMPTWSGERVQQYRESLVRNGVLRPHTGRRSGSGSGGRVADSSVGRDMMGTDDDPLVQEGIRLGLAPVATREQARTTRGRAQLQREIEAAARNERVRAETQRAAGERAQAQGADLDLKIRAATDAINQAIEALPPPGRDIPGVGPLDSLRGRNAILQSEEGIRIRTLAENAVRRYLRLESGAAISDEEMRSEMDLRGMGPGASEERFRQGLADLRRDMQQREQARGRQRPQQPAGQQPARSQAPATPPGMVRVRLPSGAMSPPMTPQQAQALRQRLPGAQ